MNLTRRGFLKGLGALVATPVAMKLPKLDNAAPERKLVRRAKTSPEPYRVARGYYVRSGDMVSIDHNREIKPYDDRYFDLPIGIATRDSKSGELVMLVTHVRIENIKIR